ncbi:MAG: MFS family permease [Cyclobacteriaceae bacterium]|jgi:MFS family permease
MEQKENKLKWPEIFSLAALNAAVVISWIAYHEYQPVLIEQYNFQNLASFLVTTKAIVLVIIPPLAGLLADVILKKNGRYFTIFTVGIGATAMIFMVVATILGAGPLSAVRGLLPFMLVIWLIAMNLFISPANSMIEAFAPAHKLPMVMGVLVLTTELIYALEPLVIDLVRFFGDTMTFVVGGILIAGTGFLFHKVSSNEVIERKSEMSQTESSSNVKAIAYLSILVIGLCLGVGKAVLTELVPDFLAGNFAISEDTAQFVAFALLGFSAFLAFGISRIVERFMLSNIIAVGIVLMGVGVLALLLSPTYAVALISGLAIATAFSILNITGLPFAIKHLSVRHVTYGVGIYLGASEIFTGIFEHLTF